MAYSGLITPDLLLAAKTIERGHIHGLVEALAIRNTKIPKTIKAIRIENAVEKFDNQRHSLAPEAAARGHFQVT